MPSRIHYNENKSPRLTNTGSRYDAFFNVERGKVMKYDPNKHGIWGIKEKDDDNLTIYQVGADDEGEGEEEGEAMKFPLEAHLRDFIVKNIGMLFDGLKLYIDESGREGKEYPTNVGYIDILGVDKDDNFVVFELKV